MAMSPLTSTQRCALPSSKEALLPERGPNTINMTYAPHPPHPPHQPTPPTNPTPPHGHPTPPSFFPLFKYDVLQAALARGPMEVELGKTQLNWKPKSGHIRPFSLPLGTLNYDAPSVGLRGYQAPKAYDMLGLAGSPTKMAAFMHGHRARMSCRSHVRNVFLTSSTQCNCQNLPCLMFPSAETIPHQLYRATLHGTTLFIRVPLNFWLGPTLRGPTGNMKEQKPTCRNSAEKPSNQGKLMQAANFGGFEETFLAASDAPEAILPRHLRQGSKCQSSPPVWRAVRSSMAQSVGFVSNSVSSG